jgi:hypothetical protein
MKKLLIALGLALVVSITAQAEHYVGGYTRHNGAYVSGHWASDPNGTVQDNWTYYGNVNPHTGTYGHNHYYHSRSSRYYLGY